MNVLFLTCWYPDDENPSFGIFVKEHARAISSQPDIHLKVFQLWPKKGRTFFRKEVRVYIDENGIETHQVFIYSFAYKLIYLSNTLICKLAFAYAKKSLFKTWQPNIIHGNVLFQAGVVSHYFAKKLNIPFLISEHWTGLNWYLRTPYVKSKAGIESYKAARKIFPVSNNLKEFISSKIGTGLSMKVVPNVVDTSIFSFQKLDFSNNSVTLLCVTNFNAGRKIHKLPGLILDALQLMNAQERSLFRVQFVGGGAGLPDFRKRIDKMNLSDLVECRGYCSKEKIAHLMQSCNALVHPTATETFGVVVAEALCCGLPCVVSDLPALRELVNEKCGIVVPDHNCQDWKEAILMLQKNISKYDRVAISSIATAHFNLNRVGSQIVENY